MYTADISEEEIKNAIQYYYGDRFTQYNIKLYKTWISGEIRATIKEYISSRDSHQDLVPSGIYHNSPDTLIPI